MLQKKLTVVILAAGKSTRMKSDFSKVLHLLGGKTILEHVIHTAQSIKPSKIILIYNNARQLTLSTIDNIPIQIITQKNPKGTGDAIQIATQNISDCEDVLVLYGDVPFISFDSIIKLQCSKKKSKISLLTGKLKNPFGYGRILRKKGKVIGIVEEKEANEKQKNIKEIYSGIFIANNKDLKIWLNKINKKNKKQEFHATDIVSCAYLEGSSIETVKPLNNEEILGVNNKLELSVLENIFQKKQVNKLLIDGVKLKDPSHFILRGTFKYGKNIEIDTGVIIEENVILGDNITIGPGCIIKNSIIDSQTNIQAYTIIENSKIGKNCIIGPFAHIRSKSLLNQDIHIGNFVEIKDSLIKNQSKIKHLSYIGNAQIGSKVNIGAGSITCNYDGVNKFKTIIDDNVLVGSNTELVAPIKIAKNTTIAAGTTLTKDVNIACLVYNPKEQKHKTNWTPPNKFHKK